MTFDRFDHNENPDWDPDALVEVTFSAIECIARNGFRPHYRVLSDYQTTTIHWFIENGQAPPNQPTQAFVKFITPEAYPNCLTVGMDIEVGFGSRVLGFAKVLEIYNQSLVKHG